MRADVTSLALKMGRGPQAKERGWSLEAGNGKEMDSISESLEKKVALLIP